MRRTTEGGPAERLSTASAMLEGRPRELLRTAIAALDLAEQGGQPLAICTALAALARAYRGLGAHGSAEEVLRQALRWARGSASVDLQVEVLCELGEAACSVAESGADGDPAAARAARERARDIAFEISSLARQVADPHWEARALLRASDTLNRCGDHEDAAWLQGRALQLTSGAPSGGC